jgi:hypothetical protein
MNLPSILDHKKILEHFGWFTERENPYQIRHKDGSFATLSAAKIVEYNVVQEYIRSIPVEELVKFLPRINPEEV